MRTIPARLLFLIAGALTPASAASSQKPDIVFIIADDLGWADVAFHGGNGPTPNLDRLRREGVELTQHYVAPVCSPTRTGLMTGRCWSRFGVSTHLDDAVGRIVTALKNKGRRENTLIVFTSDNGGSTVENNDLKYPDDNCPSGKLTGNNRPLRGQKGSVYEGGTRVPTLLSWPAKLKPGAFNGVAQITDWMPTLCALAGAAPAKDVKWHGLNLWPQVSGAEPVKPRAIYTVGPGFNARAVRDGDWKLIVARKGPAKKGEAPASETSELYDLATDANETTNLAAKIPDKVAALRARMDELAKAGRDSVAKD